jgi:hypothetical protein
MTATNKSKCKFRISVSREQMGWIMACPDCPADLRKQLRIALIKADEGMITPAYEIQPLVPRTVKELPLDAQYKLACAYLGRNESIPGHLAAAYTEYRYLNDMMDEEESAEYEKKEGF